MLSGAHQVQATSSKHDNIDASNYTPKYLKTSK